jgi:mono/diheme cytochrome c family protein
VSPFLRIGCFVAGATLVASSSAAVDFSRDIQPIFAAKCYECHGPDQRKGGLRLDLRHDALLGGDDGPVLVAGKSTESLLFQKVSDPDPDKRMPLKGEPLTSAQLDLIRRWIDAGAVWPESAKVTKATSDHWAFQPIQRPAVPEVPISRFQVQNPIDAFVRARLAKERIEPSPEADRYTLIRRLSYDLLGLPPALEDVEAFISDRRPDAYAHLVDRILASPQFGERWARHWLDLARYADSDGYEKDRPRPFAYLYRDWVINAINDDLPFDQFSIEQLAGDLLPEATPGQKVATGFHRQTLTNTEGGTDQEEFRCKAVVDRVSTTSTVWLGVTMGCAECHSHKYDPFTQREFYQLFAFFNNASETNMPAPQPDELARFNAAKKSWEAEQAKLKAALDSYVKNDLPAKFESWAKDAEVHATPWTLLKPGKAASANGATLTVQKDSVVLSEGRLPDTDTYTIEAETELAGITGFRLEAIDDPAPKKGPGRAKDGNFVLTKFAVSVVLPGGEARDVALANPMADHSQNNFPVANALKGGSASGWAVAPQLDQSHVAVFETAADVTLPAGAKLVFTLDHQYKTTYLLQRFRLSATSAKRPLKATVIPDAVVAALGKPAGERPGKERELLAKHHREQVDAGAQKLQAAIDEHKKKEPAFPPTFAAIIAPEPGGRDTRIHVRGNFLDRGAPVSAGTPSVLHPLAARSEKPDRLDLAHWLFDPANPLTARVSVNHVWKNLFGRGLVATVDDFGTRGEKPTHPGLLDWLATEFPRLGWSRKELIKTIVMSATYRQDSRTRPELESVDPLNTLLARQNRLRFEAETVRDAWLAASGLLTTKLGGPSIRPPLPEDIAALGYANSVKWAESKGADKYRRGLYIFFQRTVPYPMLMTFDAPDSNATCTRRERSNTPLQALTLLNDPVFFECAQVLGKSMADLPVTNPMEKIRHGFQRALARPPTDEEMARLARYFDEQLKLASRDAEAAASIAGGSKDQPDVAERATLVAVSRVILNLDEFITRN